MKQLKRTTKHRSAIYAGEKSNPRSSHRYTINPHSSPRKVISLADAHQGGAGSMSQSIAQALYKARTEFDKVGRIATDTAAKLMGLGLIPHILEDQWSRTR